MSLTDNTGVIDADQSPDAYLLRHPIESLSQPIAITPNRATVGRSPKNTICVDARTVSRRHAIIISRDGKYYVNDMNSRNGTYINGKKINISPLAHRDRIAFGNQCFLFLTTADDAGPQSTDSLIDANSTIVLNRNEIDPSGFLAYAAENARSELFPQQEDIHDTEAIKPLKQAHQRLSLLYGLSERLRATQHPHAILMRGLELILEAIPSAARALILLRSGQGGTLEIAASLDRTKADCDDSMQISKTLLDWVVTEKMALMTQNVSDNIRLKDSESIKLIHQNAFICVPIIAAEKVIGVLYADSGELFEEFTQEDTSFSAAVASELALTIANIRLQKKVIHNERMAAIGLTVSNLAHNIKNLNMMNRNAVELMQLHLDRLGDEKANKSWQIIGHSISRINDLSLEMLDYVGEQPLNPKPTEVNQAIRSSIDVLIHSLPDTGIELRFNLSSAVSTWKIDDKQFQRALVNLVVNAIDAVAKNEDGKIVIGSCIENEKRLVVSVCDNGCGMEPENKKKIFDLFFTTKGTKGSGLGLPLVVKFIESSGGKLLVDSAPEKGATFKMVFPSKP
ncbi:MAG: ATP-binding protein [Desulfosarcina sp.]|jgi:signal transduction histidine kinase